MNFEEGKYIYIVCFQIEETEFCYLSAATAKNYVQYCLYVFIVESISQISVAYDRACMSENYSAESDIFRNTVGLAF